MVKMRYYFCAGALIAAGVFAAGCRPAASQAHESEKAAQAANMEMRLHQEGKVAYEQYCIGCHGEKGDGNGEAARFLLPRPRNFQNAIFKFSSTRSGQLPTDDDLKRTIRNGLRGSAMPAFNLVPDHSIDALVVYVKSFSEKWKVRGVGTPIPFVEDPYRIAADKTAAIKRGESVYHGYATCWTCHPSYLPEAEINKHLVAQGNPVRQGFRPKLDESEGKPNTEGELIFPPDFRRDFVRAGNDAPSLYRSIAAGISGTAMPTWVDSMHYPGAKPGDPPLVQPSDLWAISYYVQSLLADRPAKFKEAEVHVRDRKHVILAEGEVPKPVEEGPKSTGEVFPE